LFTEGLMTDSDMVIDAAYDADQKDRALADSTESPMALASRPNAGCVLSDPVGERLGQLRDAIAV
jgi:hypothetical protein